MAEVADLWAAVGARVNKGQFAQADAAIDGTKKRLQGLEGALSKFNGSFQDKSGRWRAANGRFLTMRDMAQLAKGGVNGAKEALDKMVKSGKTAGVGLGGVGRMFAVLGAAAGLHAAGKAMIGFNANAEEARLQIAGMLSLARKTDLKDQIGEAAKLYGTLQKRAAALPGTTEEYVNMAGKITRAVITAGGSVKDLEDITVNSVVAAKGLGEQWEVAARDIEQALMGRFNTTDPFSSKVLTTRGFVGEEGRERFKALSPRKRFEEVRAALMSKQFTQLGEEFGKTLTGRLDQLKDSIRRFFGAIGKPLFDALKGVLERVSAFLEENREQIEETAIAVGEKLVAAFAAFGSIIAKVFGFLSEHGEFAKAMLIAIGAVLAAFAIQAAAAWIAAFAPIVAVIAVVTGLVYLIRKLINEPEKVREAFRRMWSGITGAFRAVGRAVLGGITAAATAFWDALSAIGARIRKLFAEDIPNAIIGAFEKAFEFIASLPIVKQVIAAIDWIRNRTGGSDISGTINGAAQRLQTPGAAMSLSPASGVPVSMSVDVGGVHVNAPNANADEVAAKVGELLDTKLSHVFRQTADVMR